MIVAGLGFNSKATAASLRDALARACDAAGLGAPDRLAVLTRKADAPCLAALSADTPIVPVETVSGIDTPTRSPRALAAAGAGSVAEALALSAAGAGARLLTARQVSGDGNATCALAKGGTA